MRKVITAATVAIALVIAGHGHATGTKAATRAASTTARPAGAAPARRVHPPTTHRSTTTSTTRPKPTTTTAAPVSTTRPAATSTTVAIATVSHHAHPAGPTTTTTPSPAQRAAKRALLLQACLELASSNNFRVEAANAAWYQRQMHRITATGKRAVALRNVLLVDEHQTQDLIDAQYTIDQSNCYIKYA